MARAVVRLASSTQRRITGSGKRSAATPPTSTKTTAPTAPAEVTRERSIAEPPRAITRATSATAQSPEPKTLTHMASTSTV